jgi:lipid A oxidase
VKLTGPLCIRLFAIAAGLCSGVPAAAEWNVAAYLGAAHTRPANLGIQQPAQNTDVVFADVRFRGRSFNSPLYYGLRGGYFFSPSWGLEGEFIHAKVYAREDRTVPMRGILRGQAVDEEVRLGDIVNRFSVSHGLNFAVVNLVGRKNLWAPALGLGRVLLTARAGAGPVLMHPESTILGQPVEHYQAGRIGAHLAAGGEVQLWRGLYAMGEYKFTATRQRPEVVDGHADVRFRSHHGVFGLSIHF